MEIFYSLGSHFTPTFLSRYHRSMFRMYTVSSSQLSPPSTSCWGNAEHRMDRCRTVPYHDGGRHRYRSDRYADGGAGYDTLLCTCRMGFPFFGWTLDIDWSSRMSLLTERMANEPYSLIGIFVMMALLKGIFMSMAGPAPNYDMQKILSCKSPKEAAMMSGSVSVVLLIPTLSDDYGICITLPSISSRKTAD